MNGIAVDIQNLTKVFNQISVVDHVTLQVERGSVFGFLGSNGSGKTTMIRMICGLLTPTSGTGKCLGYNILTESAAIKLKIGYMPQKFCLYDNLTVYETLLFFAKIYLIQDVKQAIEAIITDLELTPYQLVRVGHLSGGWKQRLTLACCLLHRPEMLFLDEPTAGVDPKARKDFWNYLHKIAIRDNTTILVTTHYMDEAEKCTDLAYINLGKLLYSGTTKDLIPASKIKTYIVDADRNTLSHMSQKLSQTYPDLLVSIVNNELRISSRPQARFDQFIKDYHSAGLTEVLPSFEEVFIGLMR